MTSQTPEAPEPPAGLPFRPPVRLDQIATAAAKLIADARAAGLTEPTSLNCHDYGPPTAALYLYAPEQETTGLWWALHEWASHYGTEVAIRPGIKPDTVHACVEFRRDGIAYEVTSVIRRTPDDDAQPEPQDKAA
jgi:hypothetical protein